MGARSRHGRLNGLERPKHETPSRTETRMVKAKRSRNKPHKRKKIAKRIPKPLKDLRQRGKGDNRDD